LLCFRPVLIELPHIASLRDDEREVIALRSDDGITWHEHPVTASEIVGSLLKFAGELSHSYYYCIKSNLHLVPKVSSNLQNCTVFSFGLESWNVHFDIILHSNIAMTTLVIVAQFQKFDRLLSNS